MARQRTQEVDAALLRAGKHYAAAYLLMTIAIDHIDDGDIETKKIGLYRHEVKQLAGRVQRAFNDFCADFSRYLDKGDGEVVMQDWERLTPAINEVLDLQL